MKRRQQPWGTGHVASPHVTAKESLAFSVAGREPTPIPTHAVAHLPHAVALQTSTFCCPSPRPHCGHWDLLPLMPCHQVAMNARDAVQLRRLPGHASKSLMCSHLFWGASDKYLFATELHNSEGSVPDGFFHTRYELGFFSPLLPL